MEVTAFLPCLGLGQNRGVVAAGMSECLGETNVGDGDGHRQRTNRSGKCEGVQSLYLDADHHRGTADYEQRLPHQTPVPCRSDVTKLQ